MWIKDYMFLSIGIIIFPFWLYTYIKCKKQSRKEMILCGLLFGIAAMIIENLYSSKDYWHPHFLLSWMYIEDLIYGFLFGGIACEMGQVVLKLNDRKTKNVRYNLIVVFFAITVLCYLVLTNLLKVNSIYPTIIPSIIVGIINISINKKYLKNALVSGFLMTGITIFYYNILLLLWPTLFTDVWYLKNVTGIFLFNIPFEEVAYAFALGFGASNFYELVRGKIYYKKRKIKTN